jgi:hypothetical protein
MKSAFALLSFVCLMPASAHALSCVSGPYAVFPSDTLDVPLNAQIVVWYSGLTVEDVPLQLVEVYRAKVVPVSLESVEDSGAAVRMIPDEPLKPDLMYRIEALWPDRVPQAISLFNTGESADTTAPKAPGILSVERGEADGEWGPTDFVRTEVNPAKELVYYRVEVSSDEAFTESEFSTVMTHEEAVKIGHNLCENTLQMPAMDVRFVRLTAIDMAGNESVNSQVGKTGGCSVIGASGLGWLGFGVIPLVFGRRRQR